MYIDLHVYDVTNITNSRNIISREIEISLELLVEHGKKTFALLHLKNIKFSIPNEIICHLTFSQHISTLELFALHFQQNFHSHYHLPIRSGNVMKIRKTPNAFIQFRSTIQSIKTWNGFLRHAPPKIIQGVVFHNSPYILAKWTAHSD